MSTGKGTIRFRRERKLQEGGARRYGYTTGASRPHTAPMPDGTPVTQRPPDTPDTWVEHAETDTEG